MVATMFSVILYKDFLSSAETTCSWSISPCITLATGSLLGICSPLLRLEAVSTVLKDLLRLLVVLRGVSISFVASFSKSPSCSSPGALSLVKPAMVDVDPSTAVF
jgi:hypothetical protein